MKALTLLSALLRSGLAVAEGQQDIRVNRIDLAIAAPDESGDGSDDETTDNKATDYNASRSNKNGEASMPSESAGGSRAQDYNPSRSNNINGAVDGGGPGDADSDATSKVVEATDYNSSRSNKSEKSGVAENNCGDNDSCDDPELANHTTT